MERLGHFQALLWCTKWSNKKKVKMKDISYETHTNKDHNVTKDKKGEGK